MGYTADYWAGFFPLLLVNIAPTYSSLTEGNSEQILTQFCCAHHLVLQDWQAHAEKDIMEAIIRFMVHLDKCGREAREKGKREWLTNGWQCPNECGLKNVNNSDKNWQKKKRNFFQAVKKSISSRKIVENS